MRIDVHAHAMPAAYIEKIGELGGFDELPVFEIMKALFQPGASVQKGPGGFGDDHSARLADMDAAGVDYQLLSVGAAQPYFADEAKAVEAASFVNDLYADIVASAPERLGAFATVPLPHARAAAEEAARRLDSPSFLGVNIGCSAAGIPLDDASMEPFWAEMNDRRAVVYMHPGVAIGGIVGCTEHHLAPDFVSPAELGVSVARLVVEGVTTKFPDVRLLLATSGGALPFFASRYDRGLYQDNPDLYEQLGGFTPHLRKFFYDTSVLEEPLALEKAAERFGADRLMLGSDYPRPHVTSQKAVDYVEAADFLTADERAAILDSNALALFGELVPRAAVDRAATQRGVASVPALAGE